MVKTDLEEIGQSGLLLFSGGFDSTFALYLLLQANKSVIPMSVEYVGRPQGEVTASARILSYLGVDDVYRATVDLGYSVVGERGSEYEGWFPYRNILFFAMAAHIASKRQGIEFIAAGHRAWDIAFSDATREYFVLLDSVLRYSGKPATDGGLDLFLPLIGADQIIRDQIRGHPEVRTLVEMSWSCWRDGEFPCGECDPCEARNGFLREALA